jgi:hypothetical protein
MSTIQSHPDANIRSQSFAVARSNALCGHCGEPTDLIALVVPHNHEFLEALKDEDEGDHQDADGDANADGPTRGAADEWQRANTDAFLFYVDYLSDGVRDRLQRLSPCFRVGYSVATLNSYWANHCEHCGMLLDDHELHCEPEGAFMPTNESAASAIQMSTIQAPFEASAAGYSPAPEFFRFIRRP